MVNYICIDTKLEKRLKNIFTAPMRSGQEKCRYLGSGQKQIASGGTQKIKLRVHLEKIKNSKKVPCLACIHARGRQRTMIDPPLQLQLFQVSVVPRRHLVERLGTDNDKLDGTQCMTVPNLRLL